MIYLVKILYTYVFEHCPATGLQNGDEASPSIILAGQALLMKKFVILKLRGILFKFCIHCPTAGMQNDDEASPNIILAGQALLVKVLITLGPHGIFCSIFVYSCILNIAQQLMCKMVTRLHRASFWPVELF